MMSKLFLSKLADQTNNTTCTPQRSTSCVLPSCDNMEMAQALNDEEVEKWLNSQLIKVLLYPEIG